MMTRITLTTLFIFYLLCGHLHAQTTKTTREEYIRQFRELAISEMKRSGIPASITLAQGCLESNNGNSVLASNANNHFGIKCKGTWKGKSVHYDDDTKNECFRKYNNAEDSYIDHTDFIMKSPRYAALFALHPTDYTGWAKGLKRAGYATDPHYAEKLIRIIEDCKLHMYDEIKNRKELELIDHDRLSDQEKEALNRADGIKGRIVRRNDLRTLVVQEGETLQNISEALGMQDWELYTYNDFSKEKRVRPNEIIYLEAKRKKADRNHLEHFVEGGDSMHFISQRYGIKLKPLLRRNRMKKGEEPEPGQIIYLRKKKPRD